MDEQERGRTNLGHLLLTGFRSVVDELFVRLAASGYTDLRTTHSRVFEQMRDEGVRVSELAEGSQMTHQSMSELVAYLEGHGYVERIPDPNDARAKLVRLTAKGHELSRTAAGHMEEIEARWSRVLGARRMRELRAALEDVTAAREVRSTNDEVRTKREPGRH
jgi:DNA-binding MarR family transcriptional regulator